MIDEHILFVVERRPKGGFSGAEWSASMLHCKTRETLMTVSQFANVVDRMGFGLINLLVVVGLPLAAIGLFIQPL
jgi:hypothetical protein